MDTSINQEFIVNSGEARVWPQSRIGRFCNLEDRNINYWNSYLNNLGRLNRGKGSAMAIGSVHMTYVNANEIGKMLSIKYSKVYESSHKAFNLHRKLAKSFINYAQSKQNGDMVQTPFGPIDLSDDQECSAKINTEYWNYANVRRSDMDAVGKGATSLAIFPYDHDVFEQELEDVAHFLKNEGLNTKYIDRARQPHLVIFKGIQSISSIRMLVPDNQPTELPLDPPVILTS